MKNLGILSSGMKSYSQSILILTGCSRGLGREMARDFARAGWLVAGCARSPKACGELARELGEPHSVEPVDVADESAVAAWAAGIHKRFGAPDLLINNAAVIAPNAPLWEVAAADFDRVIDVNLKGPANVIRHVLPAMLARRRGVIVNFSSGWGRSTSPEVAAYCASKWAIEGLTQALSQELPAGMAAVALNPGIIDTDMLRECFGAAAGSYPTATEWIRQAGPFLRKLGPAHNGRALTVPGMPEN